MIEIRVPEMGESITEATISSWLKQEGEAVAADQALAELETDKTTVEVYAPQAGVLTKIVKIKGETVSVREVLALLDPNQGQVVSPDRPQVEASTPSPGVMPSARKLLEEQGLASDAVTGTGRGGRILKEDVQSLEKISVEKKTVEAAPRIEQKAEQPDREKIVPMSRLRQTIARRLVQAQQNAAILTTFNEVDMSQVMELRARYKDIFKEKHQVALGFMSFFAKAAIQALRAFPAINAEIRGTDIVYKNFFDIGVAVGGPKGLVVPVIRGAQDLSLAGIESEIMRLAGKVKEGTISLDELQGGTFSITNGGIYGSMMSTPILNPPQSGILGMHNIVKRAVVVNDEIVIRPMMYIALSYDHRIVDGKEAVQFLVMVKDAIEDPARMLLEV